MSNFLNKTLAFSRLCLISFFVNLGSMEPKHLGPSRNDLPVLTKSRSLSKRNTHASVPHIVQIDGSMNNPDLISPSLCEAACFAATYSFSTVPYYSLDQPRSVTIVYNGDQRAPRPTIFADINGDDGTGVAINNFTLSATVNGSAVTFLLTGSTQIVFSGNLGWIRLAGQFDASNLATNIYPMVVSVKVSYADGVNVTKTISTQVMVINEASASVARGWTIAGVQHLYSATAGGYLITEGDGGGVRFTALGAIAADYSILTFDNASATYTRSYADGSRTVFNSVGQEISAIDVVGRSIVFAYDASGRVTQIGDPYRKQPNGSPTFIGLSYDANGLALIQQPAADGTPWAGRATTFSADASRCLSWAQDPDGGRTWFTCDGNGRLSTVQNRLAGVTTFGYDPVGWKLSQITLPQIPVDAGGGATTLTNPVLHFSPWQGSYANYRSSPTAYVQNAAGQTTMFLVNKFGQATDITDAAGRRTIVTTSGILPTRITSPDGWVDTLSYDTRGRVVRVVPAGDSATVYHYNATGLIDSIGGPGARAEKLVYSGNQIAQEILFGSPQQTLNYTYDPVTLRPASIVDNAGHTTSYGYDSRFGNTSSTTVPGNRQTTKAVDGYGRDSAITVPGLAPRILQYDVVNRLTRDSIGTERLSFSYPTLTEMDVDDAKNNHFTTTYNTLGMPVQECDPLMHCSSTRYNVAGLVMSTTNRRGDIVSVTRDALGRMTSRSGSNVVTNNYGYSANGRILAAWNAFETDSVFTDPGTVLGARATDSVVTWIDGRRYRVFHSYRNGLQGTDTTRILSTNSPVIFSTRRASYDVAGRLTSLYDGFNTSTFTWTSEGIAPTTLTYGVGGNRTTALTALHQVKQIGFSSLGPSNAFSRDYHYDGAGRIDQAHSPGDPTHAYTYGFDTNGRLQNYDFWSSCSQSAPDSTSGIANSCGALASHQAYVYDNMGNRIDHGAVVNTGNRYQSFNGITFVYDNDGNVTQRNDPSTANRTFYWNAESQLDSVIQNNWDHVRYDYNAFGQPVRKLRSSPSAPNWAVDSYFLWDGDQLLAEFDPSGNRRSDYLYFPGTVDQPYAHTIGATTPVGVRYQEQDQLGNVLGTMDNGNVSQTVTYDIWGKPLIQGNTDNRLFWKGLMWEGDIVSLYYMRNRWYDPDVGRFVSEDPAGFAGGSNLFAFGRNDPVNASDPSGLGTDFYCVWSPASDNPPSPRPGVVVTLGTRTLTCYFWDSGNGSGGAGSSGGGSGGGGGGGFSKPTPHGCALPPVPLAPPGVSIQANMAEAHARRHDLLSDAWFVNKVLSYHPWDYKHTVKPPGRYEAFGNANFGATGIALGFNETTLLWGAGAYQFVTDLPKGQVKWTNPNFDNIGDANKISQGVQFAKEYYACMNQ